MTPGRMTNRAPMAPATETPGLIRLVGGSRLPGSFLNPYTTDQLRRAIPAQALVNMLTQVAFTGTVPQVDPYSGVELGPSRPVDPEVQIKAAETLLGKVVPNIREDPAPYIPHSAPTSLVDVTPDSVRSLTRKELEDAVRARVAKSINPEQPTTPSEPPTSPPTPPLSPFAPGDDNEPCDE